MIKVIREFKQIQKKICRHKMSIMFNEICINKEMLPKYTYICVYIYIYIYICVCVCVYGHLPPITKTIQVRRTRHAGHCWRSRDEHISDVLLWSHTHGYAKAGWPARTYIQQLCEDTGCCPEDLPEAMNDREKWWERVRDIRATSTTWWWEIYIYIYIHTIMI